MTALHERGLYFWRERFFQDPHMRFDIAVPGAQAFAHACYDAGAVLVYMTGRDLPNMALGTLARLRDLGYGQRAPSAIRAARRGIDRGLLRDGRAPAHAIIWNDAPAALQRRR